MPLCAHAWTHCAGQEPLQFLMLRCADTKEMFIEPFIGADEIELL